MNASLNVWFSALYATAKTDPALARLASIKELGWRLRDMAGQERSIVASAISSAAAIPADGVTNATAFRARVFVLWDQLRNLTLDPDDRVRRSSPPCRAPSSTYFKDFLGLADELRKLSANGAKYPMNAATSGSTPRTPLIGSLLDVMYAAGKASETYTATTLNEEVPPASSISAGPAGAVPRDRRAVVLGGDPDRHPPAQRSRGRDARALRRQPRRRAARASTRTDEIGKVAGAVVKFRDNVTEQRRLADEFARAVNERDALNASLEGALSSFRTASDEILAAVEPECRRRCAIPRRRSPASRTTATSESAAASAASEDTSSKVQTVAAAAEQLSVSIQEISRQVTQATTAVRAASATTERSADRDRRALGRRAAHRRRSST